MVRKELPTSYRFKSRLKGQSAPLLLCVAARNIHSRTAAAYLLEIDKDEIRIAGQFQYSVAKRWYEKNCQQVIGLKAGLKANLRRCSAAIAARNIHSRTAAAYLLEIDKDEIRIAGQFQYSVAKRWYEKNCQ